MEKRRAVTEGDLLVTEAMIARSFTRLQKAVGKAHSQAACSAGETVKKHPLAAVAVAIGGGIALYGLFRAVTRHNARPAREPARTTTAGIPQEILSMIIPVVTPYVTAYLKDYLDGAFSRSRR